MTRSSSRATARFIAGLAATMVSSFSALAPAIAWDGAGLFALPAERILVLPELDEAPERGERGERASSAGSNDFRGRITRALLPALENAHDIGVLPQFYGFTGFGLKVSGKMK